MIDQLHITTKKEKSLLTSDQKTFNRLIKKVKELQGQQSKMENELNLALQLYYDTIKPDEETLSQALMQRIEIAYQLYKNPKELTKKEREVFKIWLREELDLIYSMNDFSKIPQEIKNIFKEFNGIDFNEGLSQEIESIQERMQKEFGVNIDLSDVNMQGSQEDLLRNIFFKMGQAAFDRQQNFHEKPKTKKQLEKESKKQAIEEIQSKSLHTIYKQLARILHPDLEQDSQKRSLKEELMKKLTSAYKNNDLYSLLTIQMEWMNASAQKLHSQNDKELKIYNTILKDQINELEMSIDILFMHPRYISLQKFYQYGFNGISTLKKESTELKKFIQEIQVALSRLQAQQTKTYFKEIIKQQMDLQSLRSLIQESLCTCGSC